MHIWFYAMDNGYRLLEWLSCESSNYVIETTFTDGAISVVDEYPINILTFLIYRVSKQVTVMCIWTGLLITTEKRENVDIITVASSLLRDIAQHFRLV